MPATRVATRLRAASRDPARVVGLTVGVLLVVVPAIVLAALVASGHTGDAGGLVLLVGLVAVGGYVCVAAVRRAGDPHPARQVVVTDETGLYGRTVTLPEPTGPGVSPWRMVAAVLGLLVVGSLGIAVLMSVLDDHLRGRPHAAQVVVTVISLAAVAVVGWGLRRASTPRPGRAGRARRGRRTRS